MRIPRRRFLYQVAGAAALPALSRIAKAQAWPSRPVRFVVGYPPGGALDITARLIAHWLSERLGQQFIVENRPGANSNIATEAVVRAAPDGYTFLALDIAPAINAMFYEKLNFDFIRDIAPVAGLIRTPNVMVVNPSVPAKTVAEFIGYAKANPGKINMASTGNGSQGHLSGELFKMMTGTNMIHVPYRGGAPALTDLIGGQVQLYFGVIASSIEYIKAGKVRALAVTTATRSEALPDIPTVGDFVSGYEASIFYGIGAPKNAPAGIVEKLNKETNTGLADPRIKARFADLGSVVFPSSPTDFGKFIAGETEKWAKVIKSLGIKLQ
jgi:tripartite-type tricarboxylate transporter receptor subunit TctC